MIRLRCETGIRSRSTPISADGRLDDWIELALGCARLQAGFVIEHGRKIVPLSELCSEAWCEPIMLYDAGVVELVAWEETLHGKIKRVRRADLSRTSAQVLVESKLLPRCFLPVLVALDLLDGWLDGVARVEDQILFDEFQAWLGCGGLQAHRQEAERKPLVDDHLSRSPLIGAPHRPVVKYRFDNRSRQLHAA